MLGISKLAESNLFQTYVAYPSSKSNHQKKIENSVIISNRIERNIHLKLAYQTGMNGCYSQIGTRIFLDEITRIKPNIIHLHNLHNCYINLEMLFKYIKKNKIPIIWTLHDCWAFTGQCPHYTSIHCNKWKTGCFNCPQFREYPAAKVDKTKIMYELKRDWFTGVENMTIVTPSNWLKEEVKKSFLSEYTIKTINNGIDLSVFQPTESKFRIKYNLQDKIVLLGVANPWSIKKGLNIFHELADLLNEKYKIVLVGLSNDQIKQLPSSILGLLKTNNQIELAEIYTAADFFVNPSIEETMGLVTVEALACGTPAIVSNSTAVPEMITDKSGAIVSEYSVEGFMEAIINNKRANFKSSDCINHAQKFEFKSKYNEYIKLYNSMVNHN